MNLLSNWFRNLLASEQVERREFRVVNPFAEETSVDTLVLSFSPATEESPKTSLSIYWKDSSEKVYEKHLDDENEARSLFDEMSKDLEEAQNLTHSEEYDTAKSMSSELFEKYSTHSDTVVKTNNPPLTTTQANKKEAKVIMQNIFFDTPEEAEEYQKKMKDLQPGEGEGKPLWEQEGEPTPDEEDVSLSAPSVSYKDLEKQEAEEAKHIEKRIEKEVKEQIESTLENKRATLFDEKDDQLVDAMRGVGRTWEEIKDYMTKSLKYDKDGVDAYVDQKRSEEEGLPSEKQTEAPRPPKELVSPETHDKLIEEVDDIKPVKKLPAEEEVEEIANLSKQDGFEIQKKALNPLQEAPAEATPAQPQDDIFNVPDTSDTEGLPDLQDQVDDVSNKPQHGDRVYVMSDPHGTSDAGYEGTIVSTYSQKGDKFAVISTDDGDLSEVPMHQVVKVAAMVKITARKNEDVIRMFVNDSFPKDKKQNWGTANLRINKEPNGWSLMNYATPILYRADGGDTLYFNTQKYSVTTSKIQNEIRSNLSGPVVMTDEAGVKDAMAKSVADKTPAHETPESKAPDLQQPVEEGAETDRPSPTPDPKISSELVNIQKEAQSLLKVADEPEEKPIQFKQPKIAPPHVDKEKAVPATPEISDALKQIDNSMANIEAIRSMVDEARRRLNSEIKAIEEKGGRVQFENQLREGVDRLSALIDATESKLVQHGDRLITFKQEEKIRPPKLDYKWQLDKVLENVRGARKFLDNAMKGAQSLATKETVRELVVFPEKGKKRISKLDKSAHILDVLQEVTEDLMSAFELFNEATITPQTAG